jgi:hypothetical protein
MDFKEEFIKEMNFNKKHMDMEIDGYYRSEYEKKYKAYLFIYNTIILKKYWRDIKFDL